MKVVRHFSGVAIAFLMGAFFTGSLFAAPLEILKLDDSRFPFIELYLQLISPYPEFVKDARIPELRDRGPVFTVKEEFRGSARKPELVDRRVVPASADRLDLVLILDSTLSVQVKDFRRSVADSLALLEKLNSGDRVALYSFQATPNLLSGYISAKDESLRKALLDILQNGKGTHVYDALYSGLYTARQDQAVSPRGQIARKAVLIFTDGRDEGSYLTESDVHELAALGEAWNIPVFTVLSGPGVGNEKFQRLAMKTGGRVYDHSERLDPVGVAADLRRLPGDLHILTIKSSIMPSSFPLPGERFMLHAFAGWDTELPPATIEVTLPVWKIYRDGSLAVFSGHLTYIGAGLLLIGFLILISLFLKRSASEREKKLQSDLPEEGGPEKGLPEDLIEEAVRAQAMTEEDMHSEGKLAGDTNGRPVSLPDSRDEDIYRSGSLYTDIAVRRGGTPKAIYMRDYAYRMLQNALRNTPAYTSARLDPAGDFPPEHLLEYDLFLEHTLIGSGSLSNIRLKDSTVSPVHARIRKVDNRYVLYDLVSATGTRLNGKKLLRPRGLRDGDIIKFGSVAYMFVGEEE